MSWGGTVARQEWLLSAVSATQVPLPVPQGVKYAGKEGVTMKGIDSLHTHLLPMRSVSGRGDYSYDGHEPCKLVTFNAIKRDTWYR
jgi:hypothetical protein